MRRELNEIEAGAMTVNERLVAAGLMEDFDHAVGKRDVSELQRILHSVYIDSETTHKIIEQALR